MILLMHQNLAAKTPDILRKWCSQDAYAVLNAVYFHPQNSYIFAVWVVQLPPS